LVRGHFNVIFPSTVLSPNLSRAICLFVCLFLRRVELHLSCRWVILGPACRLRPLISALVHVCLRYLLDKIYLLQIFRMVRMSLSCGRHLCVCGRSRVRIPSWKPAILPDVFRAFPKFLQANALLAPLIRSRALFSTSLCKHYSSGFLGHNLRHESVVKLTVNKQINKTYGVNSNAFQRHIFESLREKLIWKF
jgi:hypothetical protein